MSQQRSGFHTHFGSYLGRLVSGVSLHVRRKMFGFFINRFPDPRNVLDVGVTSDNVAPEANYFEELFPDKSRITAVGVEDAGHLAQKYPGLTFVQIKPGEKLPFQDHQFEVVFSNAVIEHIVDAQERRNFLQELCRVGKSVFITTPNKYFPIEAHTGVPFLHFLFPSLFYRLLDRQIFSKFYNSGNLKLLTGNELQKLVPGAISNYEIIPVRFMGFTSNWILILRQ